MKIKEISNPEANSAAQTIDFSPYMETTLRFLFSLLVSSAAQRNKLWFWLRFLAFERTKKQVFQANVVRYISDAVFKNFPML